MFTSPFCSKFESYFKHCFGFRAKEFCFFVYSFFFFLCPYCVFTMKDSGAASDQRAAVEVTKDRNGIEQVVLRNPRGASAKVRTIFPAFCFSFKFIRKDWKCDETFISHVQFWLRKYTLCSLLMLINAD